METPEAEGGTVDEIVAAFKASGAQVADLCSSAKVYAQQGVEVARALRDAGARAVYLSGAYKELGISDDEAAGIFDGRLFMGMDVVDILTRTFDVMGVAK